MRQIIHNQPIRQIRSSASTPVVNASVTWERLEGEPIDLYSKFQMYLLIGPNRTLVAAKVAYDKIGVTQSTNLVPNTNNLVPDTNGVVRTRDTSVNDHLVGNSVVAQPLPEPSKYERKANNAVPVDWYEIARRWNWKLRAEAWDEQQLRQFRAEVENERLNVRRQRIASLMKFKEHVDAAMDALNPLDATWSSVASAMKVVTEQLRIEYGDDPKQRTDTDSDSDSDGLVETFGAIFNEANQAATPEERRRRFIELCRQAGL